MSNKGQQTLVIGLLQVGADPWKNIYENGQLPTWIKHCPKSAEVVNIYGRTPSRALRTFDIFYEKMRWSPLWQGPINFINRFLTRFLTQFDNPKLRIDKGKGVTNLFVGIPSMHLTLPLVEIGLFRYFLQSTDAKFLYMSNSSSYVNIDNLLKLVDFLPEDRIYGGTMLNFANINFASGANRLLSRDTVQFLVNEFKNWNFQYVDDVSLGKLLLEEKLNQVAIPSISFSNEEEINAMDIVTIKTNVHFRLKSGPLNSRNDVSLMHCLHSRILNNV